MRPFDYYTPESLDKALSLLDQYGGKAKVLAGGTDLLVSIRAGLLHPACLIDVSGLAPLRQVTEDRDWLRIGAGLTHAEVESSVLLQERAPLLVEAVRTIGAPETRNLGTLGGNLASGLPSADTAPPLLALDARVKIVSSNAIRIVPVTDFFRGPRETVLKADEILAEVLIPSGEQAGAGRYLKLGRRKALSLALVGVAVWVEVGPARKTFQDVRIALGAVSPTPIRAKGGEAFFRGKRIGIDVIEEGAQWVSGEARPIDDFRASADYRKEMVGVLARRGIESCLNRLGVAAA
ncbi:MAG: xanthine dehydrogenase family protein subunit M [Deltaproteobacteria bacterium]|nr:MAG: xanthine dehydrogenase family protein subunit M [Deltaproteobacteria bacterium]